MRIGLVFASASAVSNLAEFAKAIAQGMEAKGHRVDLLDARTDDSRKLPGYEYVVIISEPLSFLSGKIPEVLPKFLNGASSLVGKKGAAFLRTSGPFSAKAMAALMRAMEKEGMWVNWSEMVANPAQAMAAAKRIGS
ncbi:MAG: hypothetical protein WCT14_14825 [Treponemataceae bacterium]